MFVIEGPLGYRGARSRATPNRLLRNWFAMAYFEAEITRFLNMHDKGRLFSQILSRNMFLSKTKIAEKGLFG